MARRRDVPSQIMLFDQVLAAIELELARRERDPSRAREIAQRWQDRSIFNRARAFLENDTDKSRERFSEMVGEALSDLN